VNVQFEGLSDVPRFLVGIVVMLPPDMPADERSALLEREARRAGDLMESGVIRDIWRVPGRLENVGVWEARNATALHEAISSLPVWTWSRVTVTPLANHYLTRDPEPTT
jgi:muconolactone D-isomerase